MEHSAASTPCCCCTWCCCRSTPGGCTNCCGSRARSASLLAWLVGGLAQALHPIQGRARGADAVPPWRRRDRGALRAQRPLPCRGGRCAAAQRRGVRRAGSDRAGPTAHQTVVCEQDGALLQITYDEVRQLYFQNPKFGFFFLELPTSSRPSSSSISATGSTRFPTGCSRRSASAATSCRPASGSWWRWSGRRWSIPTCWCSTRHLVGRRAHRGAHRPGARQAGRRPHHDRDRPPAVDRGTCGRWMVLDHGRLVEDGSHAELLVAGRLFRMYEAWIAATASTQ